MSMSYWRLFYHLVWATYERMPVINADVEVIVRRCLHAKAKELNAWIHEVGVVEDHIHLVITIPPTQAVAELIGQMKGSSSHAINATSVLHGTQFRWQEGYGALSIGERSLPAVIEYTRRQKEHHATKSTKALYERTSDS
jgi:putative transposase